MELRIDGIAAGGEGVGREPSGRVVFVRGALPGETVAADMVDEHDRWARADLVAVLTPSADRVDAPCPAVALGCGGCGWQHVRPDAQRRLKVQIVRDALERLGGITDPQVGPGPELATERFRTTVRAAAVDGKLGFRRHRGHDVVPIDSCLVAHPLVDDLLRATHPGDAAEVVVRCGAATGETLVGEGEYHEVVAGHRFRISAGSFFQSRADGAEVLVEQVGAAIADAPPGPFVDAYGGVGLFAGTVAGDRPTIVLEQSRSAVDDARVNVPDATVLKVDVARWRPSPAAVVVADPARMGLGKAAVGNLSATGATHLVLVSCDPASLGRDARLLIEAGFRHDGSTLVDLFPHTPHVEVVTRFIRDAGPLRTGSDGAV